MAFWEIPLKLFGYLGLIWDNVRMGNSTDEFSPLDIGDGDECVVFLQSVAIPLARDLKMGKF